MPTDPSVRAVDRSQRRASYQQARSRETKHALVQAAVALWRAHGYAGTTVADICRAAGVSKGLFYFHFPRKEDVLLEVGVLSTRTAERETRALLAKPYEVFDVVDAVLAGLERSMRRNPPELIIATILEGYRYEHRVFAGEQAPDPSLSPIFTELFERALADGKLPAHVDTRHLAQVAQSLVSEGARHWAAGVYGDRRFADVVGADIRALVTGACATEPAP